MKRCVYCATTDYGDEANFCYRCGFPVRPLSEIPDWMLESFKKDRPRQYQLAVAWFGGDN